MKHGTNSRYIHGCRCKRCTEAHRHYENGRRRKALETGEASRTPADHWRLLLHDLTLPTMHIRDVAQASGVSVDTLREIRAGNVASINRTTREALRRFEAQL